VADGEQPEPPRFTQRTVVPVVIAAAEGRGELTLAVPALGPIRLARAGELVLASTGQAGAQLSFEAPPTSAGVTFDGRSYPGAVRVLAREEGGLRLVNDVDLELYVEAVVAAELPLWSAVPAELSAQAIAVRTYALVRLGQRIVELGPARAFLWDSVEDQAFRGRYVPSPGNVGEERAARRLLDAVQETRGLVLVRDDRLFDARFHAACGGRTSALEEVFPGAHGPGPGVDCAPCAERARAEHAAGRADLRRPLSWSVTLERDQLATLARGLGVGDRLESLSPTAVDGAGRWLEVRATGPLGARAASQDVLRRSLGFGVLKSARIESTWPRAGEPLVQGLALRGLGRGHGVGLCQEGAHDYAARGWTAGAILEHYYPGVSVVPLPGA